MPTSSGAPAEPDGPDEQIEEMDVARKLREPGAVTVNGDGVRIREAGTDVGVAEAHRRFGGVDVPATLAGMLAALGLTVLLGGLLTGAGSVGYQQGLRGDSEDLSAGGLAAGLVVLLVAFLVGGWVAGRMARYDGARNGLLTAVWFLVLVAAVAVLGAWLGDKYDFLADVHLPQWFSGDARTAAAVGTGVLAVLVTLVAATVGGKLGARYHQRADELLVQTRPGGIASTRDLSADHERIRPTTGELRGAGNPARGRA